MLQLLFFLTVAVTFSKPLTIPSYIHVCHRSDPKLGKCIINSVESLRPQFKNGFDGLNLTSIEPLAVRDLKLKSGPSQVHIDANLKDIKLWGTSEFKITKLTSDIPNKVFNVQVSVQSLNFEGGYNMDINVLIVKYNGQGIIKGIISDALVEGIMKYNVVKINGKDFMKFDKIQLKMKIKKIRFELIPSSGESTVMINGINQVLNDNYEMIVDQALPSWEEGLSERFTEIANDITKQYPYDELLPI